MKPKANNKGDTHKVSQMDICQTPPHALEPLYPYLKKEWIVWESACGPELLIVKTLEDNGFTVLASDLMYGKNQNFFLYEPIQKYDIQITNMPFSIKYEWLKKSFEYGKRFALLAPYETHAAAAFHKLAKKYHNKPYPIEVLTPERRINYKMPNKGWDSSAQMPTCWITWGLDIYKQIDEAFLIYQVPMRSVRYDSDNKPIERIEDAKISKKN